jgi:1,4-dihydroxy-2-naphthoate octaprenyltransferase
MLLPFLWLMLLSFPLAYVVVFSFGLCCCLFLWLMLLSFPLAYVVVFSFDLLRQQHKPKKRQQHKPKERTTT